MRWWALACPGTIRLHKVTIIPRGRALGMSVSLPERDKLSLTKQTCVANLASVFGGREAELLIFGPDNVTTGASGDIQQATGLARRMVMEWGMSDKLGRIRYRDNQEEVFLGHSVSRAQNISEETARLIDAEIRRLIVEGEETARKNSHRAHRRLARGGQGVARIRDLVGPGSTRPAQRQAAGARVRRKGRSAQAPLCGAHDGQPRPAQRPGSRRDGATALDVIGCGSTGLHEWLGYARPFLYAYA